MNENEPVYMIKPDAPCEILNFAGQIIGKAMFEGLPISAKLNWLLLWELMYSEPILEDLKLVDPQLYKSMEYIIKDEVNAEDLGLTFTVLDDGEEQELMEDGAEIEVTNENKEEYVEMLL